MSVRPGPSAVIVGGLLALAVAGPAMGAGGTTSRISVPIAGAPDDASNFSISDPVLSANGRYVAFYSTAANLVPGDTNNAEDVFVRDRRTGTTTRVNVANDGTQADLGANGSALAISADGRYVAFSSNATNLVPGDTNNAYDVFVRDRRTGTTSRVSVASDGTQANGSSYDVAMSADGRYVAFLTDASNLAPGHTFRIPDVFVRDRWAATTRQVNVSSDGTPGNSYSLDVAISADGRYIAFSSLASNLVPGDTNGGYDVFVRDQQTATTTRVSVGDNGAESDSWSFTPKLSADGRYVTFTSDGSNLVAGDTNGVRDVFVRDRQTGTTTRVNVTSDGTQANGGSYYVAMSADGRYVAFDSYASNLVPGDTNGVRDVFVRDRWAATTTRVSVASDGTQADGESFRTGISADGRDVGFISIATNLVPGDTNGSWDVFVRHRA
jgi:archaellum component FlaF (FlaF/FlaG flagellin family)